MARPPTAVVDASVAAKWFVPEADTNAALALRDAHVDGRIRLVAPDILPYEVTNALRYHPEVGSELLTDHVRDLFLLGIGFEPASDAALAAAVATAYRTGTTVYDAAYLALAERLACSLITADSVQLAAAGPRGRSPTDGVPVE